MILHRVLELLPLSLVLGLALAALRHEDFEGIQRAAVRNTVRILAGLAVGCAVLQGLLWLVQD